MGNANSLVQKDIYKKTGVLPKDQIYEAWRNAADTWEGSGSGNAPGSTHLYNNSTEYPTTDWGNSQSYTGGFGGNTSRVQSYQPQSYQPQGYQPPGNPFADLLGQWFGQAYQPEYQEQGYQPAPIPMQPQQQFGRGQSYADRVGQYDQNQQKFDDWQAANDPRLNALHSWERANLTPDERMTRKSLKAQKRDSMSELQFQQWEDQRKAQRTGMLDWEHEAAAGSMLEGGYTGGMSQEAIQGLQAQRKRQEAGLSEFDRRERQQVRNQYQDFLSMSPSQRAGFNDQGLFDRYDALFGIARGAPPPIAQAPSQNTGFYGEPKDYGQYLSGYQGDEFSGNPDTLVPDYGHYLTGYGAGKNNGNR